ELWLLLYSAWLENTEVISDKELKEKHRKKISEATPEAIAYLAASSIAIYIEKHKELVNSGTITDEEYKKAKELAKRIKALEEEFDFEILREAHARIFKGHIDLLRKQVRHDSNVVPSPETPESNKSKEETQTSNKEETQTYVPPMVVTEAQRRMRGE
ncbi:MAG: hypothetical protein QXR58_02630, partial [Candidatus Micrarchaeaceae archaeon]